MEGERLADSARGGVGPGGTEVGNDSGEGILGGGGVGPMGGGP